MLPTALAAIWLQQTPGSGLLWEFANWLENTQITEEEPFIQVAAVFTGQPA